MGKRQKNNREFGGVFGEVEGRTKINFTGSFLGTKFVFWGEIEEVTVV